MIRDTSNDSYPSAAEEESSSMASPYNNTSSLHNQSPTSSTDDYRTSIYSAESTIAKNTVPARVPPPTNLPTRHSSIHAFEKYRKALFDFTGQNNDEISFKTGDIIAVIDEIDKGWWLGEINSNRGIFPVNYTEEYIPLPPKDNNISDISTNTHALRHSYQYDDSILNDNLVLESSSNNARRPPVSAASSSPTIPTLKSSLSRKRSNAIRAPPPPPPTARFSSIDTTTSSSVNLIPDAPFVHEEPTSYIKSNSSSLHDEPLPARSVSPPPPPPSRQSVVPEPYLDPIQSHTPITLENIDLPCHDCDCHDYIENPFKPGQCNNCFHTH
ncbi:MAG: SH3 domain-containing protein [Paenibacillus sp.]|nr:SH3 domain-containing protein [Paenibacillus sp.]